MRHEQQYGAMPVGYCALRPYSTFHRWVRQGVYPLEWGGAEGDLYDELE